MKKTKYVISIDEPLRLAFDTLEREQAFMMLLDGANKRAGGLFLPRTTLTEYPDAEGEDDAKF